MGEEATVDPLFRRGKWLELNYLKYLYKLYFSNFTSCLGVAFLLENGYKGK